LEKNKKNLNNFEDHNNIDACDLKNPSEIDEMSFNKSLSTSSSKYISLPLLNTSLFPPLLLLRHGFISSSSLETNSSDSSPDYYNSCLFSLPVEQYPSPSLLLLLEVCY
jgi:hypothetical protein